MKYIVLTFAVLLAACAQKSVNYVGLADENNSFVRTVSVQDTPCETVQIHHDSAPVESLTLQKKKFDTATVCEATLPAKTSSVQTKDSNIVIPHELRRVIIMGDTGCRLKNENGKGPIQKCEDEKEWPFARVIRSAQAENADLIIHVGDYHYREACSDPVKCAPYAKTIGYGYNGWSADFVNPATSLLDAKPFIFVRGNHEDCHRAHEGFSQLLTPVGETQCVDAQETRYSSFGNLLIVNFDDASLNDRPLDSRSAEFKELQTRWSKMIGEIKSHSEKEVWLVTHRPIWGVAPSFMGAGIAPVNANMQEVATREPLPAKVKFIFAGHIHNFQIATGNHPTHIIVGESGTALDFFNEATRKTLPAGFRIFPSDHGYLVMDKDSDGKWIGKIKSYDGNTDYTCDLEDKDIPCN